MRLPALLVLALLACGCASPLLSPAGTPGAVASMEPVPGFAQGHDHRDPSQHAFSQGVDLVSYDNLAPGLEGADASKRGNWVNSEIVVRGEWAFVGYLGGPARFAVVNVADAAHPKIVGTFPTSAAWTMDLTASDDGNWVYASVTNGAIGTLFDAQYLLKAAEAPDGIAGPGLLAVDVRDKAHPALAGFLPIHGLGPHTAVWHKYADGREVVFAQKAEGNVPANGIVAVEVLDDPAGGKLLRPISFTPLGLDGSDFPHDVDVQVHPVTNRTLLYVAGYYSGLHVYDVGDPAAPVEIGAFTDYPAGEDLALHDVHPFPGLVAGRHYTVTAPELLTDRGTGHLRFYDTTDPAKPRLVSSWTMPGNYTVDVQLLFSPHNFVFLPDGRVALSHGHAGVWIVDWLGPGGAAAPDPERIAHPRATGYYVPHPLGASPPTWTPVPGVPWVWGTGVDANGHLWALDVATGLHGLAPAPFP
jgi:hypothetical protein